MELFDLLQCEARRCSSIGGFNGAALVKADHCLPKFVCRLWVEDDATETGVVDQWSLSSGCGEQILIATVCGPGEVMTKTGVVDG